KLLRVLQERYIQRLGSAETIPVDVRVLAATHRDLDTAIQEKEFRQDLFYRLSVVTIALPPLRERADDIPDLVRYFIQRYGKELGSDVVAIQPEALTYLQSQPWPGNVRELENVVRQALLQAKPFGITLERVQQIVERARRPELIIQKPHGGYIAELLA